MKINEGRDLGLYYDSNYNLVMKKSEKRKNTAS